MASQDQILTVTELTRRIKVTLEGGFRDQAVTGELSNVKFPTSGHLYFTLKDAGAQLSGVMWRSRVAQLLFRPCDGMKVIARGNITVYEPRGNYQIDCYNLAPSGLGELQAVFEKLKQKLRDEGLFADEHKRPLPLYPSRIGIVTSATGAAIHDMLTILAERFPAIEVVLAPVKVQGIGAAEEIAAAIHDLNQLGTVDVIVVGRGGGSIEDLWAFNEEIVARAIFSSAAPVVSAVGHETDFTISDFVADLRAPTPSAAATLVVRDKTEILDILRNYGYTSFQSVLQQVKAARQTVRDHLRSHALNRPVDLLHRQSQRVDELDRQLMTGMTHMLSMRRAEADSLAKRIHSLDPQMTLKRGFAVVRRDQRIVSSVDQLASDDEISISFRDGTAESTVRSTKRH